MIEYAFHDCCALYECRMLFYVRIGKKYIMYRDTGFYNVQLLFSSCGSVLGYGISENIVLDVNTACLSKSYKRML